MPLKRTEANSLGCLGPVGTEIRDTVCITPRFGNLIHPKPRHSKPRGRHPKQQFICRIKRKVQVKVAREEVGSRKSDP